VKIAPMERSHVDRVSQLTLRTNQMNATTIRRSSAEIQQLGERSGAECLTVHVSDRFGSYGLTGAMIYRVADRALVLDTFLLSCRALGRGVEHRMVARLGALALERGLAAVEIPYAASQRNRPALRFLRSLGASEEDGVFRLAADAAARVEYHPAAGHVRDASSEPARPAPAPSIPRVDYSRIANRLRTVADVQAAIRAQAPGRSGRGELDPPRTPLERDLCVLWAELLHLDSAGIHENFFELGGHSLLAVQLLSRVRHIYGVELSLEVVYSGEFTVAELAKAIELKEIEQAGGDYRELIEELENLSDDEVRALLAEEQDAM
jgi:hypothetical protein